MLSPFRVIIIHMPKLTSESVRVAMLSPFCVIIIQFICETDLRIIEGVHVVPVSRDYYTYAKLTSESVRVLLFPFLVIILHMPN